MTAYHPSSRRPISDLFRRTASWPVRWSLRLGVPPNLISYSSILAAGTAGLCFWQASTRPWLLIPAVACIYLRLWLNMLDGMVALAGGTATATGEIVNELPDRVSDVIIFTGVAHSGLCHPLSGYWAAIGALMAAYAGTLGQAVGAQRQFGGLMSKPWRMVALSAGALITLAVLWWPEGKFDHAGLRILDWTCLAIIAGCVETVWVRLARVVRLLNASGPESKRTGPT